MQDKLQRFKQQFAEETRERIRNINNLALSLEKDPAQPRVIDQLKREMHTIKGGSRILGFKSIAALAHFFEDFLQRLAGSAESIPPRLANNLFRALDLMAELLDQEESPSAAERIDTFLAALSWTETPAPAARSVKDELRRAIADRISQKRRPQEPEGPEPAAETPPEAPPAPESTESEPGESAGGSQPDARFAFSRSFRIDSQLIDKLSDGALQLKVMTSFFQIFLGEYTRQYENVRLLQQELKAAIGEVAEEPVRQKLESLHLQLRDLGQTSQAKKQIIGSRISAFQAYFDSFYRNLNELKLLPLSTIFTIYPRFIRDYAVRNGKQIDFEFQGGATQLDKRIAEAINESLIHLLRNAVDHGLESPETRRSLGKDPTGRIRLLAATKGDRVRITVEDDGRGFDPQMLRDTAVQKQFLTAAEAARLSDAEALELVFLPNLSTAPIITDTSGRGIGMDVVSNAVKEFGGTIRIESEKNRFSRVLLELPISISTTRVLHLREGNEVYALPVDAIRSVRQVRMAGLVHRPPVYFLIEDDRSIRAARLAAVLGTDRPAAGPAAETKVMLLLQTEKERFGLLVDQTLEEEDVIVHRKDPFIQNLPYLAGISVSLYGEPFLVLDSQALSSFFNSLRAPAAASASGRAATQRVILLVEDSMVTREMEKVILESAGFRVIEALNGMDGLEKLGSHPVDCVVTDVEMPLLDGFALTEQIRRIDALRRLPVIIVTTRENREDKIRGIQAGANAYITKKEFDQFKLVETINRLI